MICSDSDFISFTSHRSEDSEDEMDDFEISKLMIVTQTPPPPKKHDRTGNFLSRAKMTAELAQVISDGLYYYEQDLHDDDDDSYLQKKVKAVIFVLYLSLN